MTQEDKQLLLKDLCARLPYGVKCKLWSYENESSAITETIKMSVLDAFIYNNTLTVKPYLRPMSSMTEEEINEFILISDTVLWIGDKRSTCILSLRQIDWLNAHHFDYRGLIPMGLALKAKEGMYKTQ